MRILRRAAGAAVAAIAAVSMLGACAGDVEFRAVPEVGTTADSATTGASAAPTTTRPAVATTTEASSSVALDIEVAVGECVDLGGTTDDATIDNATCGSPAANYKVVDIVESSDECGADIDQTYFESFGGVEVGALCLDIDWQVGDCMDLGGEDPERIDCAETALQGEKVTEILTDTADVDDCAISSGGYVYAERRFVVCSDSF